MEDFSLIEKIQKLMNIIISSPLFLFCSMLGVAVLIYYIISLKKDRKVNKWIFIGIWSFLAILLIVNYSNVALNLIDNSFENVILALYFPDLTVYIIILSITNFFFFYSIFSKRLSHFNKIINFVNALIIDIFLILIIDIVNANDINVYEKLTIYSNSNLLILLELTSAVFTSWILIILFLKAYRKLKKIDKKESNIAEIVFEDIK